MGRGIVRTMLAAAPLALALLPVAGASAVPHRQGSGHQARAVWSDGTLLRLTPGATPQGPPRMTARAVVTVRAPGGVAAEVTLVGPVTRRVVKPADGAKVVRKVRLAPGRYRVDVPAVVAGGTTYEADVDPVTFRVRKQRSRAVVVTLRAADAPPPVDADEDGFPEGVDCADDDSTVNPGAVDDPRDGIDQDCDGADARLRIDGDDPFGDVVNQQTGEDAVTGPNDITHLAMSVSSSTVRAEMVVQHVSEDYSEWMTTEDPRAQFFGVILGQGDPAEGELQLNMQPDGVASLIAMGAGGEYLEELCAGSWFLDASRARIVMTVPTSCFDGQPSTYRVTGLAADSWFQHVGEHGHLPTLFDEVELDAPLALD